MLIFFNYKVLIIKIYILDNNKYIYFSGLIAERTNISTIISKLSGSKGVCHSSCVTSRINALHL